LAFSKKETKFAIMDRDDSSFTELWNKYFGSARKKNQSPRKRSYLAEDSRLTAWAVEFAKALRMPNIAEKARVVWNPRMQTTAGRAFWPDCRIELNPMLKDCAPGEIWRTLKHEMAHLVAYERYQHRWIEPHGVEWQAACTDLGIPGEPRCHDLPFTRRKIERKHAYICPNCSTIFPRVRPLKKGEACSECCRKFNGGNYSVKFRLRKHPL
jgi:SprT protein